jgi:hypothetical protein
MQGIPVEDVPADRKRTSPTLLRRVGWAAFSVTPV